MTVNMNDANVVSPVEELETEIVYGPPTENGLEPSLGRKLEYVYHVAAYWLVTFLTWMGPWVFFIALFIPGLQLFCILYIFWIYYDKETPHNGGRRFEAIRKAGYWRYPRDYFPIRLVKTANLPLDTTYVFSAFPHGILVYGTGINFISDVNHFDEAFPGIKPRIITLSAAFNWPVMRDMLVLYGLCASSERSIKNILNGPPGNALVLLVGGVAEALLSAPGINRLVLKNRKGFVRVALEAGSSLVPVFSFGETDSFDQLGLDNHLYRWLQSKMKSLFGFPLIFFKGRGILPYQVPITTVVGKPIKLPKVENPSQELVDKYHQIFVEELTNLFHKYKGKYDPNGEKATLTIE